MQLATSALTLVSLPHITHFKTFSMSPKLRAFLKALSYLLALLAGTGMASCNFMNLNPIIY
jgi:hypothetical protein